MSDLKKEYYHKGQRVEFDALPLYFKNHKLNENGTTSTEKTSTEDTTSAGNNGEPRKPAKVRKVHKS